MTHPWGPGYTPEEEEARTSAYRRLVEAARRTGTPLVRLAAALRMVARNEAETRRFLTDEVYGVPDSELDTLVQARLQGLDGSES